MARAVAKASTSRRILDIAEKLVQTRGFNGFSYADIASVLRVTKASLHYHFPSKAELGARLIERHDETFRGQLDDIERADVSDARKLALFVDLYAGVLTDNRMCLCGMLAAEQATLPRPMRAALTQYFTRNEMWLTRLFEHGRINGQFRLVGSPRDEAIAAISLLKGAMLIARARGDHEYFDVAVARLLRCVGVEAGLD
jgi:TetR/AcrR family transcriptional repressor of nem operon